MKSYWPSTAGVMLSVPTVSWRRWDDVSEPVLLGWAPIRSAGNSIGSDCRPFIIRDKEMQAELRVLAKQVKAAFGAFDAAQKKEAAKW